MVHNTNTKCTIIYYSAKDIEWSDTLEEVKVKEFKSPTGPTVPVPCSILETFFLLFTRDLIQYIADQTNLYAQQCMGPEKYADWTKVTPEEINAFFGFMILMGLVQLPALSDYWSKDDTFRYGKIADRITRDRFLDIMRYIHFVDNTTLPKHGQEGYNKLGKVQPIIDIINKQFQTLYNVSREVSVDEAMIPFKGRSSIKQYMPNKPVKRGIKVWAMADARTGFISKFDVYTGKKGDNVEKGLGSSVVKHLTSHLQNK